ncbi:MAG: hypothetical protein WCX46_04070 [Candidatus Paceibacterota bacterium]|jgi:hypothetical protein
MNYIEKIICRWIIKNIKKDYSQDCKNYDHRCIDCRSKKCIEFLNEHIELLDIKLN